MQLNNFKTFLSDKFGINKKAQIQLEGSFNVRNIVKGEYLLKSGEICDSAFFVEKGLLRTYFLSSKGEVNILQFATEGWIAIDRGSLYFQEPSIYYIDAIEDTQIVIIDNHFLDLLTEINPYFGRYNERLIQNHVRHLNNRVRLLLGASAESRYLEFIKLYPDVLLRVPQWMVASYLGITPESLSRVRKALSIKNFNK